MSRLRFSYATITAVGLLIVPGASISHADSLDLLASLGASSNIAHCSRGSFLL